MKGGILCLIYTACIAGGSIPDAAAIHAARKKREAMREGRGGGGGRGGAARNGENGHSGGKDYIPLGSEGGKGSRGSSARNRRAKSDDSDDDEDRIDFAGVRTDRQVISTQMQAMGLAPNTLIGEEDDDTWEHQQIRKAMKPGQVPMATPALMGMPDADHPLEEPPQFPASADQIKAPVNYNLQGIKGRLLER